MRPATIEEKMASCHPDREYHSKGLCAPCYLHKYNAENKDKNNVRCRQHREENQRNLITYFENHPCVDCGETDPIVLEFDHIVPRSESNAPKISTVIAGHTWENVLKEISKCEVRCANCHTRKTSVQFGYLRVSVVNQGSFMQYVGSGC